MKKNLIFLTLFVITFFYTHKIHATTIQKHSFLITPETEFVGTPLLNSVIYSKLLNIGYRSGKVVISSTPDGLGPISIPDDLVVNLATPTTESFRISPGCPTVVKPPVDITHLLWKARNATSANLLINLTYTKCKTYITVDGIQKVYARVGPLYLVHFDDYDPTASSPFLELPWNYKAKNMNFSDAVLAMTAYFDHSYPLLSTSLAEPDTEAQSITTFENQKSPLLSYSSHDGYDWAYKAGATLEEPVLAAADGIAQYVNTCGACGNAIYIDHGNSYQTRYYHMLSEGLLTTNTTQKITVKTGQPIGKVGYTGNVFPVGSTGAHLHFMVVYDKNHDGNFDDNIPDGIVDPFGWQSESDDPWEQYTFTYKGQNRTGNKSTYLWKNEIATTKNTVTPNGGTFSIDTAKIIIPKNMVNQDSILTVRRVETPTEDTLSTIKNVRVLLKDGWGNVYTTFQTAFNLILSFNATEISRYKPETLSIYSTTDGHMWNKENTSVDTATGQASITVKHLSEFALRGEKKDSTPPTSTSILYGSNYSSNIFVSPVEISLDATDVPDTESLGIDYILYKLDTNPWQEYTKPIVTELQGNHTFTYYAVDGDGNSEMPQTKSFSINYLLLTPTATPTPTVTPTVTPTTISLPTPTSTTPFPTTNLTPAITPTIKLSPTKKFTPTPKPTKFKKPFPYFCKFMNQKKQNAMIERLLKKYSKEQLQKLCNGTNF